MSTFTTNNAFRLTLFAFFLFAVMSTANAAPVIRKANSTIPSQVTPTVITFRQDQGGGYNGFGKSYRSGFREVTFEEMPGAINGLSQIPGFYNKEFPTGVTFNPIQNYFGNSEFPLMFSMDGFSTYSPDFHSFSGTTIFSPVALNYLDIAFTIPGTTVPASVKGFGIVFLDVDLSGSTWVCLYDESGKLIDTVVPDAKDKGYSFIGATYTDGTRISRVSIRLGNQNLPGAGEGPGSDEVAIDNVIIGEPRAIGHHTSDFDGDGTADYAVFRPTTGDWYVLNSGSSTFSSVQFGANGDVPADGDFDGDSVNDFAVFRPSNGTWYLINSSDNQVVATQFGQAGDTPVAGDYDHDRTTDIAIWRPSDGNYYSLNSSDGQLRITHWGAAGDIPIGSR